MILKQVIRYTNADALEATWVEEIDGQEIVVKCQAYANSQMDMLAADLGDDAPDHQALMDEVAATYVPPPPAPPYVPQQVSPRQIRQALNRVPYGEVALRQAVEAAVAAGDQDTKDWWEFATVFERTNPQVIGMGQVLGVSSEQLDDLWTLAASL